MLGSRSEASALALLHGAAVPHLRVGRAFLWDAAGVEHLARVLAPPVRAEATPTTAWRPAS